MHTNPQQSFLADRLGRRATRHACLLAASVFLSPAVIRADDGNRLVFEAEEVSSPSSAWVRDKHGPDRWNLWSTDKDAGGNERGAGTRCVGGRPDGGGEKGRRLSSDSPRGGHDCPKNA